MSKEFNPQVDLELVRLRAYYEQNGVPASELPIFLAKARNRIRMISADPDTCRHEQEDEDQGISPDSLARYIHLLSNGIPDLDAQRMVWPDLVIES